MNKRMPVWAGTFLTGALGVAVAFSAWFLPLKVRAEPLDFDRDRDYILLMLIVGFFLGLLLGTFVAQQRIPWRDWFAGAGIAIAWTCLTCFLFFRESPIDPEGSLDEHINHQRELIGFGSCALFALGSLWLTIRLGRSFDT
jgi:MFS family permease